MYKKLAVGISICSGATATVSRMQEDRMKVKDYEVEGIMEEHTNAKVSRIMSI